MNDDDRPFITLPADQPDYETLCDLTLEQKAALPARFHTPDWLDTTPGAFVCRVCWDDGEVTGWPCASAVAGRGHVFGDHRSAPASVAFSEADTTTAREPRVWREGDPEPKDCKQVRDQHAGDVVWMRGGNGWTCGWDHISWERLTTVWGPLTEVTSGGAA